MLPTEDLINLRKVITKSGLKYVRISYQLDYLKSAQKQKFLPRGIADQMKYVSPIHDNNLQNLMNFAGSRMLDLLIIYYAKWTSNLRKSYYSHLAKLEEQLLMEEFNSFRSELNIKLAKEKETATKTSKSKLKRDDDIIQCKYLDANSVNDQENTTGIKTESVTTKNRRRRKKHIHTGRKKRRTDMKGTVPQINSIPEEKLKSCVINLSSKITEISEHQLYLFYLGKAFAPTPPLPDYSKFRLDIL